MTIPEIKYGSGSVFEPASSNEKVTNPTLEKDLEKYPEKDQEMNPVQEPDLEL
jgi:hypothetical protein